MKRREQPARSRTPRSRGDSSFLAETGPRSVRRKPQWNGYLTDDARYKLNQQQQLQRQLQHLSAAHFSARTPSLSGVAAASRRRVATANAHSSQWSTPRDGEKAGCARSRSVTPTSRKGSTQAGEDDSALKTARRLQFLDVSMDLEEQQNVPRTRGRLTGQTVSFQVEEEEDDVQPRMARSHKANLQGELEVLERMLWELETETERLSIQQTPQKQQKQESPFGRDKAIQSPFQKRSGSANQLDGFQDRQRFEEQKQEEEEEQEDPGDREEEDDGQRELEEAGDDEEERDPMPTARVADGGGEETEARLGDVCYKSLSIGLSLARKLDTLSQAADDERKLREDRDLKIEMLEQEVRSTQAKCNYLEAKYQSVASQVDGMREAVIATEEAIHHLTRAFEHSRRKTGKTSNPATPSKPAIQRSLQPIDVSRSSKKAATPKKPAATRLQHPMEHQENQQRTSNKVQPPH